MSMPLQPGDTIETLERVLRTFDVVPILSFSHGMFHVSNKERTYITSASSLHTALNAFIKREGKPAA